MPCCRRDGGQGCCANKKGARHRVSTMPGLYLATTYSHRTYRPTTIGAAAFHFRVRNGTGWFHHALVTRGQCWARMVDAMRFQNWDSGDLELVHQFTGLLVFIGRKFPRGACSLPVNQSTNQPMTAGLRPPARSLASTWRSGLFLRLGAGDGGHLAVLGLLPNSKRGIKTAG
jgi:hypothetical protein